MTEKALYQGIKVIQEFNLWDEFYNKDKKIHISQLPEGDYYPNMGIVLKGTKDSSQTKQYGIIKDDHLVPLKNYFPCKIKPANTEQTLALELLRDDSVPLVTILGAAGAGKTFLACAHMLHALNKGSISKLLITKSLTPVGREVGFLPGNIEEKVGPWLGAFYDNFLRLGKTKYDIEKDIQMDKIEISPITYIQGRSLSNSILVVDEVQNLNLDIVKQIITRAGENCKIILLGDPSQRFEKGNLTLSGLIDKGKGSNLVGHINFLKSVRSPLAQWAVTNL